MLYELSTRWGQARSPWLAARALVAFTVVVTYVLVAALARLPRVAMWIGAAAPAMTMSATIAQRRAGAMKEVGS